MAHMATQAGCVLTPIGCAPAAQTVTVGSWGALCRNTTAAGQSYSTCAFVGLPVQAGPGSSGRIKVQHIIIARYVVACTC